MGANHFRDGHGVTKPERSWILYDCANSAQTLIITTTILPIFFPGQNTRLYHVADKVAATLRQGLLLHEIYKALNKPQAPVIGHPIGPEEIRARAADPRALLVWLRQTTLDLRG